MSVRDEDIETRQFHRVNVYDSTNIEVPSWAERLIREQVERSPQAWTPRLVWEEIREAGHDISEDQVAAVMGA